MGLFLPLVALLMLVKSSVVDATLTCRSCTNVRNVTECVNTIPCRPNEKCYTATTGHLGDRHYSMGCKSEQSCNGGSVTAGLIGRKKRTATTDNNCHQCCAIDQCNIHLCSSFDQVTVSSGEICKDSDDIDCSHLSSVIPVCDDIHHAKKICKKWCGLCGLVDGKWSDWSAWSSCSVSCEDGHMTRSRTCTNPTPSHGGHDCIGANSDSMTCHHRTSCQVNGGWGAWLSWQPCSVTRGTGLRRRERKCDNPAPSSNGRDCHGDVRDFEICNIKQPNLSFYTKDVQKYDFAKGDTIRYKTTLVDTTGSYNSRTGVFTAPVAGLYTFTVTVSLIHNHQLGLQITTTSVPGQLGQLFHNNNIADTTSTMTGVGELQAGSQVWVQCLYAYGAGGDTYSGDGGRQNSFQGALIRSP